MRLTYENCRQKINKIFQCLLYKFKIQNNKEQLEGMDGLQSKIINAAYRLSLKQINSSTLLLFSIFFNAIAIVTILGPQELNRGSSQSSLIVQFIGHLRQSIYLRFFINTEQVLYYSIIVTCTFLMQLAYVCLAVKKQIKQYSYNILAIINYAKTTFSLPLLAAMCYSFTNQNTGLYIYTKILALLVILISTVTQYFTDELNFTCMYKSLKKNQQRYDCFSPKAKVLIKVILIYSILRRRLTNEEVIAILVLLTVIHLSLISKLSINKIQKFNSFYQICNYISWIFVISFSIVSLLKMFVQLVNDNIWLVLISFFIWSCIAFYNVLQYSKSSLLIKPAYLIKSEEEAVTYIRLLYQVYEFRQEPGNSILFLGLIKDHTSQCENEECVCKSRLKNLNITLLKDQLFFIKFVELNVKILQQKFQNAGILIASLAFYVQVMKKYPKYFYEADMYRKKNSKDKLSLAQKYSLFLIEKQSMKQLSIKNNDSHIENIKNYQLFKQQKKIEECYQKIQKTIFTYKNIYRYNSKSHCGQNILQKQLQKNYNLFIEIKNLFEEKSGQQIVSIELMLLMLFFYRCIFNLAFKTKNILKKLEIIYLRFQERELKQQSFDVNLYSEDGCVIESTIESNSIGLIRKITRNGPKIFGYPSVQSMLGLDVNKLLPKCVRQEHQKMIKRWIDDGSFRKINKLQQAFCYNYEEVLMKVHIRSQINVIDDNIVVFVGILKADDQNYMIINQKNQIDSYGLDFMKILQNQFKYSSVLGIFPKWKSFQQNIKKQCMNVRTPMFYNNKRNSSKTNKSISEGKGSQENINFVVNMQLYKSSMGEEEFIVLRKLSHTKAESKNSLLIIDNSEIILDGSQSQYEGKQNKKSGKTLQINEKDPKLVIQIGSTTSSNNDTNFSVWKILQQFTERASAGQKISYPLLSKILVVQSIILILVISAIFCQLFLYVRGIDSFNEVIYADSAVSDNMQLLQIMFNKIMMYDQHCGKMYDRQNCQILQRSSKNVEDVLYQLMALDIQDLIRNQTFFKNKYFFYQFTEINMNLNIESQQVLKVGTFQFMQYFIRSSKYVYNQVTKFGTLGSQYQFIIHNLKKNWPQMKRINHQNLQEYQAVGIQQLDQCIRYIIIITVFCGVMLTIYSVLQYLLKSRKKSLLNKIFVLYRLVPSKTSQYLVNYFEAIEKVINMKNIQKIAKIEPSVIREAHLLSQSNFTSSKTVKSNVKLFSLWSIYIFFVVFTNFKFNQYNSLWKESLISIGSLMQSQNYLLQNYFQLKAYYLFPPNQQDPKQFQRRLFLNLKQDQNQFVKTALDTSKIFSAQNMQLANQFSMILIDNICQLTKNTTTKQENRCCSQEMKFQLLSEGIMTVMTYFQRIVFQAAFQLQNATNPQEFFKQYRFQDLDKYLLYMLRMYQATQAQMIVGLKIFIKDRMQSIGIIIGVGILFLTISFGCWCFTIKKKKRELAEIYGYILAYPVILIKQSKFLQQYLSNLL